ncbi:MAG: sigma-54 dependent transcriptional regulator [Fibromonadaceae bacterium]|jgi:DNA-binding NtrC family response regulator|nr:sigma-54 dependent transcriptional regulator [Fibromonadaceae bacterium]
MIVLLADSDKKFVSDVLEYWSLTDISITTVTSAADMISVAANGEVSVAFLSSDFLWAAELDTVSYLKDHNSGVEIFVLCEQRKLPAAEASLSRGVSSYLLKPVATASLESTVRKALQKRSNKKNYQLMESHALEELFGSTPEMQKILKTIYKIAPTTSTVLITGESGTGKEFAANIIHRLSKRAEEPFLAVNCGAIPENIVESELFGSRRGAFTGAVNKKGLFEEADGGTLFLDEVAELSQAVQVKLLRFLQNREIRRVGENENRTLDVRIIAATNRDVMAEVKKGTFREDLYYRLNTFHILLPPLRERRGAINSLIKHFIIKYQSKIGKMIRHISQAAQIALASYDYPGNIRELENIIEHAMVMADDDEITLENLPSLLQPSYDVSGSRLLLTSGTKSNIPESDSTSDDNEFISLAELERRHIIKAFEKYKSISLASEKLGISRTTLWRKLEEYKVGLGDH